MIEAVGGRSPEHIYELYDRFHTASGAWRDGVSPQDIADFRAELGATEPTPNAEKTVEVAQNGQIDQWVVDPSPSTPPPPTPPVEGPQNAGDRILDSFTGARDAWNSVHTSMPEMFNQDLSAAGLLQLQYQMSLATISVSALSTGVHSLTQKLDGLLKTG